MGKGKKKGNAPKGSGKELEDLESLSISDAPSASTSEAPPDEEEEGLTGSAKRKKKKEQKRAEKDAKKVEAGSGGPGTSQLAPVPEAAEQPSELDKTTKPEPPQETVKPKEEEEDGGGLGLEGLGISRKKNRRKKGGDAAKSVEATASAVISAPAPAQVRATSSVPAQAPPSSWSTGPQAPVQPVAASSVAPRTPWSGVQTAPKPAQPASWANRPAPVASSSRDSPVVQQPQQPQQPKPEPESLIAARPEAASRFKIPKRIDGNSVPVKPRMVLTNYLPMTFKPKQIYRYDVSFKPDRPKKMLAKAFQLAKARHFPRNLVAFDQIKNCYALTPLEGVSQIDRFITSVELRDPNNKIMTFEVSFKGTGSVDLSTIKRYMETGASSLAPPTEAIQCIDVILRQGTLESYVKAGRQFFKRPAKPIDLGDGLEMWTGLFQSGIFTSRAFVNIDVAHKGFPKQQPLVSALQDFRLDPRRPLESQRGYGNEAFQAFLKGLRVVATIGGDSSASGMRREFICNGIVGPACQEKFMYEGPNGKKEALTVAQYFIQVKNVRLRYPELNCVWVGPREKTIFYPMELLEVSYGQAQNKQLNEKQLATMVKQAATPPDERKRKIEEVIENMNYSRNNYFKEFGLDISDQFFKVEAKVLQPPMLEAGEGPVMPSRGEWRSNKVYKPEALLSWGFIAVDVDPQRCDFENIISMMMKVGRSMGMNVSEPSMKRFDVNMRSLQNILFAALEKNVKFLFVIVSARNKDCYHRVKQMAERDVGILTQCMKEYTAVAKMNMQTARNILLKVNSKLMGINQVLSAASVPNCLKEGRVMVVGADVTHPPPDQSNIPSIAAVTASIDPKCFLYNIELSIQTPKKEMIVEFEDMMLEHLKVYRQHQKCLPKKIFVFRDGVSEGQFAQVMSSELQAVHNAYRTIGGPTEKPEVLFLLVQKRHHTRLFVPQSNQNVDPGTVVDKHIVHASELDFYLVSHRAIKGTARPTRYHAVCNDGRIPHDEVEQLTYYLCHLYSRCMRSVSYPTPTYYAHLACMRARSLTHGEKFDNKELERHPKRLRVMDKILQSSRMFFV